MSSQQDMKDKAEQLGDVIKELIPTKTSDLTNDGDDGSHSFLDSSDIADNLTTDSSTKVLSAKQGKALKDLIGDAIAYINM